MVDERASDPELCGMLEGVDLERRETRRRIAQDASTRQVFEVLLPGSYPRRHGLTERVRRESADGSVRWIVEGPGGGVWRLRFRAGDLAVDRDEATPVETTIQVGADDFRALLSGALQPLTALANGKLEVTGDLGFILNHPCVVPV